MLHRLECKACPLNKITDNLNPHMKPSGSNSPKVYILGEAPGEQEDEDGRHFVGKSGKVLRVQLEKYPATWGDETVRWNNVVRTRPLNNDTPERTEIECCRPSVEKDIAASKPVAIFGFGNIALHWATKQSGIQAWRGRRTPVKIGGHRCWFFPMMHPAALLRLRKRDGSISEMERAFQFDIKRAVEELDELPEPIVYGKADAEAGIELIECSSAGLARLEQLIDWAMQQQAAGFDYETSALRPYGNAAKILSAAIGTARTSFSFAVDHPEAKWSKSQRATVLELLERFLRSLTKKYVHQLAFEMEWSAFTFGRKILRASSWEDTYNQAAVLDERVADRTVKGGSLDFLVQQYFGFGLKSLSPLNRKNLADEPLPDVLRYNAMDAKFHLLLGLAQAKEIEAQGFQEIYRNNLRRVSTLVLTQIKGVPIDQGEVKVLQKKYQERSTDLLVEIMEMPEVMAFQKKERAEFNPSSNKDVGKILHQIGYHDFESVDEKELDKVDHPLIPLILKLRKSDKRLATYIDAYAIGTENSCVWPDGLIHPVMNSFGMPHNRTASEDPNVQNLPKRDGEAREVRKQIKAPPGHLIVAADHGQIQFRGIGMMSRDKRLVKYLWDRHDVHGEWAERIGYEYPRVVGGKAGLKDKKVMKDFRSLVKNQWVFPLCFGSELRARVEQLKVPEDILKPLFNQFWDEFSGVHDWQQGLLKIYNKEGIVRHMDGRLNRAPLSFNQLINYPITGLEAQIVMDGMNRLSERGVWEYQANLEIHDDLSFILPEKGLDDYVETIVTDMLAVDFPFINVPLTVEVSVGEDLYSLEEVFAASSDTWKK